MSIENQIIGLVTSFVHNGGYLSDDETVKKFERLLNELAIELAEKTRTLRALWQIDSAESGRYVCGKWRSLDGDNWVDANGDPASGPGFDGMKILLRGGPRDGVTVY